MATGRPARRMSSRTVHVGMVSVLSLALVGCGADEGEVTAQCVDPDSVQEDGSYEIVDEDLCDDDDGYHAGYYGGFFWYYGGSRVGGRIKGGTTVRPKNATIKTSSGKTIQRGGFGGRTSGGS